MFKQYGENILVASMVAWVAIMTGPAWAGYQAPGYDLQVVKSQAGVNNAAVYYQTVPSWTISGVGVTVPSSFTLPTCQNIAFARLYLDVWGGTASKTARAAVTVNGTALPTIDFGNTTDANATLNGNSNCVYGSGAGAWQLAYSGVAGLIKKDGTANTINVTITDPLNSGFDGRTYGVSLVSVYQDPSIAQSLDYYLAEADGTLRNSPGTYGSPDQRSLTFSGLNTSNVSSAIYHAGYTHGSTRSGTTNLDQLYFNGVSLAANNDASTGNTTTYQPNNLSFDVSSYLGTASTVRYSVNNAELGGTGDSYLRANIGLLEITHPVPEPATIALSSLAGLVLTRKGRTRA